MFDIGFLEILLIGVVALLVVGPERLPRLARTLGLWIGRARRYASTVKDDVQRELREHEIQQAMGGKPEMKDIYDIVEDAQESVRDVAEDVDALGSELNASDGPASGAVAKPDPGAPAAPERGKADKETSRPSPPDSHE
ncbi:MAG: Sec-independent protein translocase protein TatB [Gammaproteobacteria bacterium]|nr:Sec-independent protein translocase protein TatB [Gammaproteobacteria bacterium]